MQTGAPSEALEQLVAEVLVRDLERSLRLYTSLGFTLERRDGQFVVLRFGDRRLFLAEWRDLPPHSGHSRVNIRIIVPDVDEMWGRVRSLGVHVEQPIGDRYYGLRDFTFLDPDGVGLRFASVLGPRS